MVRHEVILRIKPEITREVIDRTLGEVSQLLAGIAGVKRVRYGVNNTPAYRHVMLVVEVADDIALQRQVADALNLWFASKFSEASCSPKVVSL